MILLVYDSLRLVDFVCLSYSMIQSVISSYYTYRVAYILLYQHSPLHLQKKPFGSLFSHTSFDFLHGFAIFAHLLKEVGLHVSGFETLGVHQGDLQIHLKEPGVLRHSACSGQGVEIAHSSMSRHPLPFSPTKRIIKSTGIFDT